MVILKAEGLRHHFPNRSGLTFPDFQIRAGERVLLVGPSGSGKTTLLNLITGVLPITEGRIALLGEEYQTLSGRLLDRRRADHMGVIFQTLNLIPYLSGQKNAALGVQFSAKRRKSVPSVTDEIARLAGTLGLNPEQLAATANRLSIGQQQRVAAIRALLGTPELIIADEPTSALDPQSTDAFIDELFTSLDTTKQGILMVSHDPSLRTRFDRVIELEATPT